jgi:hypothetical protein
MEKAFHYTEISFELPTIPRIRLRHSHIQELRDLTRCRVVLSEKMNSFDYEGNITSIVIVATQRALKR